jgi:hypothetical protein
MALMNARMLEDWLSSVLLSRGFEKQRRNWYRNTDQVVVMLNLDKSPDGGQFYINLAASPRELLASDHPPEHHCHLRTRLESLVPDQLALERALDLEEAQIAEDERRQMVVESLLEYGFPFLDLVGSITGMESLMHEHPARARFLVHVELKHLLEKRSGESGK